MQWPTAVAIAGAEGGPSVVPFIPRGPRETANGQPIQMFFKDVMRTGLYEHSRGTLEVTEETLDQYVAAFGAMTANGVDVEFTVDHSDNAEDVIGYWRGFWREGDTLYGAVEVRGFKGLDMVGVCRNVSAEVASNFKDGKGREYGPAVFAVTLCKGPVVPGQGEFVRASRKRPEGIPILRLSRVGGRVKGEPGDNRWLSQNGQQRGGSTMSLLVTIAAALGIAGLTEENASAKVAEWREAREKEVSDAKAALTQATAELSTLKASAGKPATLTPDQLEAIEDRAEVQAEAIMSLVGGSIEVTKEVATALCGTLLGEPGKRNTTLLSRSAAGTVPVKGIVEAIRKGYKPAASLSTGGRGAQQLGGQATGVPKTPAQTHLSRPAGGGGDAPAPVDPIQREIDEFGKFLDYKAPAAR